MSIGKEMTDEHTGGRSGSEGWSKITKKRKQAKQGLIIDDTMLLEGIMTMGITVTKELEINDSKEAFTFKPLPWNQQE